MEELSSIKTILQQFEKMLYGANYESRFSIHVLTHSTDTNDIGAAIDVKTGYKPVHVIPYNEFKQMVNKGLDYRGRPHAGMHTTGQQESEIKKLKEKFWQLIEQKFKPSATVIYQAPSYPGFNFWEFSFVVISKERNRSYLFSGHACD